MENPFEQIDNRLRNIENLLQQLSSTPKAIEEKIYSVKELAVLSGVSELSIRNWIAAGKIEAKRIGRRIFIEQSQFENALNDVKSLKYKR
jgi:excisionase family DNA binding protein